MVSSSPVTSLELPAVRYHDRGHRSIHIAGLCALNLLDSFVTLDDLAENSVPPIQPRRGNGADEKLAAVGVGSCVRHAQDPRAGVLEVEVLFAMPNETSKASQRME